MAVRAAGARAAARQLRAAAGHPRADAYRKRLIQTHTAECQRIHKILADASIRLGSVASDVLGVSGRAMLRALLAGERDPKVLAALARGRLRNELPELREARSPLMRHVALTGR